MPVARRALGPFVGRLPDQQTSGCTCTGIFAAAIAGAPLTNMVSMYVLDLLEHRRLRRRDLREPSRGRFKGNFLENQEAYLRNSPVFHADKVHTPLMILQNDKDGAVDFNQGVTYYNTLRQLGKEVIFLEYVGENHGLARPVNQKDYAIRMGEYFDHYLKGALPEWHEERHPATQDGSTLCKARVNTARPRCRTPSRRRALAAADDSNVARHMLCCDLWNSSHFGRLHAGSYHRNSCRDYSNDDARRSGIGEPWFRYVHRHPVRHARHRAGNIEARPRRVMGLRARPNFSEDHTFNQSNANVDASLEAQGVHRIGGPLPRRSRFDALHWSVSSPIRSP